MVPSIEEYYGAFGQSHDFTPIYGPIKARLIIQDHHSKRRHWDLRLIPEGSKYAYSWAIPKHRWPEPGERLLAVETVPHSLDYVLQKHPFEIPPGEYGAGKVYKEYDGTVVLHYLNDKSIKFDAFVNGRPRTFVLVRTGGKNWIFMGLSPKPLKPPIKWRDLSGEPIDKVLSLSREGWIPMPKIDGVGVTIDTRGKTPKVFISRSGIPVLVDNILRDSLKLPSGVWHGELFLINKITGKAAPPNIVSGFIRSRPEYMEQYLRDFDPKVFLFDASHEPNSGPLTKKPFGDRLKILMGLDLPKSFIKPEVFNNLELASIVDDIFSGKYPLTREGIVLRDPSSDKAIKYKSIRTYDVYVCDIFEGKGRLKGKAGGFWYSFDPSCSRIDGKVGTGFSDAQREYMWKNRDIYRGAVAIISGSEGTHAIIQPRFIMWHPEKNQNLSVLI